MVGSFTRPVKIIYCLSSYSPFPDSKDEYPDFPFKNGGMSNAIELKRPVGAHCHGPKTQACEESVDKLLAKKKLYIASAVCLVFMIGEVIGKKHKEKTLKTMEGHQDFRWIKTRLVYNCF